jgi:hypothetical protein
MVQTLGEFEQQQLLNVQIFGEFEQEQSSSQEFIILGFSPGSVSLQQRWRNNGLSADFLSDYLTTFFPIDENNPDTLELQTEIKTTVGYIANELLENAMKFHDENSNYSMNIQFQLYQDHLILSVTNSISSDRIEGFKQFIQELLNSEPSDFYVRQIAQAKKDKTGQTSGLGLLTIIDDYGAKLGWKFEQIQTNPDVTTVTTMAQLAM